MARFWFLLFWAIAPQAFAQSPTIDTPNGKLAIFPADNPWNRTVTDYKRHPNSDAFVNSIGVDKPLHPDFGTYWRGKPIGIPYVLVGPKQKIKMAMPMNILMLKSERILIPFNKPEPAESTNAATIVVVIIAHNRRVSVMPN